MNREALTRTVRQQLARSHIAQQAASRDADRKAREANAATEGDAA